MRFAIIEKVSTKIFKREHRILSASPFNIIQKLFVISSMNPQILKLYSPINLNNPIRP